MARKPLPLLQAESWWQKARFRRPSGERIGMALAKTTNPITALMRTFGTREGGITTITTAAGRLTVNGLNYEYMPNDGSSKRVAPNGINDSAKSAVLLRVIRRLDPEIDALIAH